MYFIRSLIFILLVLNGISCYSQDQQDISIDSSNLVYRHPSIEKMDAYKNMDEYKYDTYVAPESLWDKFLKWFLSLFEGFGIQPNVIKYSFIGIGILLLLFIVLKLIGIKPSGLFIIQNDPKVTQLNFKQSEDDIYNQDLDDLLQLSIRNNAYREAVRILYLICLRHLDQTKRIDWKPWKTNHDYYYEIKNNSHNQDFKQLVTNYEYVWYGHFSVDHDTFTEIKQQFEKFMSVTK